MPAYSSEEAQAHLDKLKGWQIESGQLVKTFQFHHFRESLAFVNKVGELAEAVAHHPDIEIHYNQVRLSLSTHDAGEITEKDFDLATRADKLA